MGFESVVKRDTYQPSRRRYGARDANHGALSPDQCSQYSRQIEVLLSNGNFPAARQVIDVAEAAVATSQAISLTTPLAMTAINQDNRVLTALENIGIRTVGDLLHTTREQLLSTSQFGYKRVDNLIQFAAEIADQLQDS